MYTILLSNEDKNHFWSLPLPNISNLQIESQQFLPRMKLLPYYTQGTAVTLGRQNYGVGSFLKLPSPSLHAHCAGMSSTQLC